MTFLLAGLSPEVMNIVLQSLGADDIINLSQCMPVMITEAVYNKVFRDNTHFSRYDTETFEQRAQSSLYMIGDVCDSGQIGYNTYMAANYEPIMEGKYRRMHTPWKVDSSGTIVQVSLGSDVVYILNTKGEIYFFKTYNSKAAETDITPYVLHKVKAREQAEDDYEEGRAEAERIAEEEKIKADIVEYRKREEAKYERMMARADMSNSEEGVDADVESDSEESDIGDWYEIRNRRAPRPLPTPSESLMRFSEKILNRPYKPTRFVQLGNVYGRFALDEDQLLWYWPVNGNGGDKVDLLQGVPICLVDKKSKEVITDRILTLIAGDGLSCLVEGRGIVTMWKGFRPALTYKPNGVRNGYPCLDNHLCYIEVDTVPNTVNAKDYVVLDGAFSYLKQDGTLETMHFDQNGHQYSFKMDKVNEAGPFSQMAGVRTRMCLVSTEGRVTEVTDESLRGWDIVYEWVSSRTIKELDSLKIASVAAGQHHLLALTDNGDVYAWRRERMMNGCMGLGRLEDALKMDHVTIVEDDDGRSWLTAFKPLKLKLPGRARAIFACGDYSAILI